MNREFLEALGLEKEAIDKIMGEHGKSVQAVKTKADDAQATVDGLQAQLSQRDKDIDELKSKSGSSEEVQKQLEALQGKYTEETEDLQKQIAKTKLDSAIDLALAKNKARNGKAVRALLETDKLELSDEGVKGLEEQLATVKTDNPYLFEEEEENTNPNFSRNGNPGKKTKDTGAFGAIAEKYKK